MDIKNISTKELIAELQKRDGVKISWFNSKTSFNYDTFETPIAKILQDDEKPTGGCIFVDKEIWN